MCEESGLDWYYFGARYYDPAIGRWLQVDPLASSYPSWSPYNYTLNNPINATDPDGRWVNFLVGAAVGAATDVAFQMIVEGKSLSDVDVGSVLISAGAGAAGVGLISKIGKVISTGKKLSKAAQLSKNIKQGAKFEKTVEKGLSKTDTDIAKQITIKTNSGTKTKLDFASKSKKTGQTKLTEAKSSQKASLTKNQKKAIPEIAKDGGTVVGQGKGKFPGGTKIQPTEVNIIRK